MKESLLMSFDGSSIASEGPGLGPIFEELLEDAKTSSTDKQQMGLAMSAAEKGEGLATTSEVVAKSVFANQNNMPDAVHYVSDDEEEGGLSLMARTTAHRDVLPPEIGITQKPKKSGLNLRDQRASLAHLESVPGVASNFAKSNVLSFLQKNRTLEIAGMGLESRNVSNLWNGNDLEDVYGMGDSGEKRADIPHPAIVRGLDFVQNICTNVSLAVSQNSKKDAIDGYDVVSPVERMRIEYEQQLRRLFRVPETLLMQQGPTMKAVVFRESAKARSTGRVTTVSCLNKSDKFTYAMEDTPTTEPVFTSIGELLQERARNSDARVPALGKPVVYDSRNGNMQILNNIDETFYNSVEAESKRLMTPFEYPEVMQAFIMLSPRCINSRGGVLFTEVLSRCDWTYTCREDGVFSGIGDGSEDEWEGYDATSTDDESDTGRSWRKRKTRRQSQKRESGMKAAHENDNEDGIATQVGRTRDILEECTSGTHEGLEYEDRQSSQPLLARSIEGSSHRSEKLPETAASISSLGDGGVKSELRPFNKRCFMRNMYTEKILARKRLTNARKKVVAQNATVCKDPSTGAPVGFLWKREDFPIATYLDQSFSFDMLRLHRLYGSLAFFDPYSLIFNPEELIAKLNVSLDTSLEISKQKSLDSRFQRHRVLRMGLLERKKIRRMVECALIRNNPLKESAQAQQMVTLPSERHVSQTTFHTSQEKSEQRARQAHFRMDRSREFLHICTNANDAPDLSTILESDEEEDDSSPEDVLRLVSRNNQSPPSRNDPSLDGEGAAPSFADIEKLTTETTLFNRDRVLQFTLDLTDADDRFLLRYIFDFYSFVQRPHYIRKIRSSEIRDAVLEVENKQTVLDMAILQAEGFLPAGRGLAELQSKQGSTDRMPGEKLQSADEYLDDAFNPMSHIERIEKQISDGSAKFFAKLMALPNFESLNNLEGMLSFECKKFGAPEVSAWLENLGAREASDKAPADAEAKSVQPKDELTKADLKKLIKMIEKRFAHVIF